MPSFAKIRDIQKKLETARIPADRVLRTEAEGRPDFTLIDGVIRHCGERERIGEISGLLAVNDQVPYAVSSLRWSYGQDTNDPTLTETRRALHSRPAAIWPFSDTRKQAAFREVPACATALATIRVPTAKRKKALHDY